MRNSPRLPVAALILAAVLVLALIITTSDGERIPLTELELGMVAGAVAFGVYGIQGLISVALEGRELRTGKFGPWLTDPISAAIVLLALALFVDAVALAYGIVDDWRVRSIGALAGGGSIILALLLVLYKEAFVGNEAGFDDRQDGIPW